MTWFGYINGAKVCSSRWAWLCRVKLLRRVALTEDAWVRVMIRRCARD